VIFLGAAKVNPKLRDMPTSVNFVVERGGIRNLAPLTGEPPLYKAVRSDPPDRRVREDYAVISRLPGLQKGTTFFVLGSRSSIGTWAATECAVQPDRLKALLSKLKPAGDPPLFFEAVIKVQYREGTVPVDMSYVSHREVSERRSPGH
jgi:hypothetical protein